MATHTPVLVGDIGGTNARLAIAQYSDSGDVTIGALRIFQSADYPSLEDALQIYLDQLTEDKPAHACFGIAGPIVDGVGTFTNSPWRADTRALKSQFGFKNLQVINDFAALAFSVPYLPASELITVHAVARPGVGPISVIGPGTGLGVTLLLHAAQGWQVIATEGGHRSFAPTTIQQLRLFELLHAGQKPVSAENLLSGAGIATLYQGLATLAGQPSEALEADQISERALNHSDPLCSAALSMFWEILGSVAGDTALIHGATGGLYLGGGIPPKIKSLLPESNFLEQFQNKGPMRKYLEQIPIYMIDSPQAALKGAALWFWHQQAIEHN